MNIAFSFLTNDEENGNFILETFDRLSKSHLDHTFLFISNSPMPVSPGFSKNVISVVIAYDTTSLMKRVIWYNLKIRKIIKRYRVDILISHKFCSLILKTPQILIAPDLSYIFQRDYVNKRQRLFYKKFTPRFLKKANWIIASSKFEKESIMKNFKLNADKIEVIYNGVNENSKPIKTEEKESIKEKFAEGKEYFIYSGNISPNKNLINLLKGYSYFKKRQKSSMQLIIAGKPGEKYWEFKEALTHYRFKNEIKLLDNPTPEESGNLIASCYAIIDPALYNEAANTWFIAMQLKVPLLTSFAGVMPEIGEDASLYFNPENPKDIAEKMMLIFKDEKLRKELIERMNGKSEMYNWEKSSAGLWATIKKSLKSQNELQIFDKLQ